MRRILAAVGAGVLTFLALPAAPASAAFSQAAWTSPEGVAPPAGGSDDWTATVDERTSPPRVTLAGIFDHPDGVAQVTLALEQGEYAADSGPPCAPAGFDQTVAGAPSGPTAFTFEVLLPCNGTYVIRANATSRPTLTSGPETTALRLRLTMAAPAVPVTDLRARATSGDDPEVALSWAPVAESDRDADFAGYDVERSVGGDDYEVIASLPDPDAAAFVDESLAAEGGAHRYRVVSIRRAGADDDSGVVAASDAAPEAEVDVEPSGDAPADDDAGEADAGGAPTGVTPGRGSAPAVRRSYTPPSGTGTRTYTTVDTGFGETLPFEQGAQEALPAGDPSVVARLPDDGGSDTQKQTLALVAGGSAMAVGALGVRRLLRKAAAPTPFEILQ